ncbi:hypothetical protein VTK73DRAFT_2926 [Phialemonium thermophilum]|uniref:Uncharacterized protein n=1 Tax=Phialemonium thermophilum TaxID=223376 RepID=A0ABR3X1T3_9PEZI
MCEWGTQPGLRNSECWCRRGDSHDDDGYDAVCMCVSRARAMFIFSRERVRGRLDGLGPTRKERSRGARWIGLEIPVVTLMRKAHKGKTTIMGKEVIVEETRELGPFTERERPRVGLDECIRPVGPSALHSATSCALQATLRPHTLGAGCLLQGKQTCSSYLGAPKDRRSPLPALFFFFVKIQTTLGTNTRLTTTTSLVSRRYYVYMIDGLDASVR